MSSYFLPPVLRAAVIVFGFSSTTVNTLTGRTFTSSVILTTTFLVTVSAGGVGRIEGFPYRTIFPARTSGYGCSPLHDYCFYLSTRGCAHVQCRTLFEVVACLVSCSTIFKFTSSKGKCTPTDPSTPTIFSTRGKPSSDLRSFPSPAH